MVEEKTTPKIVTLYIPPYEERLKESQEETFRFTNKRWNADHFNSIDRVGKVFTLIREANLQFSKTNQTPYVKQLPKSYWIEYYLTHGKNLNQLHALAKEFQISLLQKDQISITFKQALCYTFYRILDQTFQGFRKELLTISILEYYHPDLDFRLTDDEEDRKYGVDILAYNEEGKLLHALQLRNKSFFVSIDKWQPNLYKNDWVVSAVDQQYQANKKFYEVYGVKVDYISLEGDDHERGAQISYYKNVEKKFEYILQKSSITKEEKTDEKDKQNNSKSQ